MTSGTRARKQRSSRSQVRLAQTVQSWLSAGQLEAALSYLVHDASLAELDEIQARSVAVTESIANTYNVIDNTMKLAIIERITGALAVDAMHANSLLPGEVAPVGETLNSTLRAINADLSRRASAALCLRVCLRSSVGPSPSRSRSRSRSY